MKCDSYCSASTLKGRPCRNRGTVEIEGGSVLCMAHAKAALRAVKTPKNSPPRPARITPTPAPGPKWAPAEPSGPFSAKTIRRQIERLERRDTARSARLRALADSVCTEFGLHRDSDASELAPAYREAERRYLNRPSRYTSSSMVPADHFGPPEGAAEIKASRAANSGTFRLETDGNHGTATYFDHVTASAAARELSLRHGPGGEGYAHGIVYVNRETPEGRRIPAGAYARGRRAA